MPLRPAAVLTPARPNERCVVCGSHNPAGLRIRFSTESAGQVAALWHTSTDWEGFRGVIHGGIVSTVLDEAMSKAVASNGWPGFTCELRVRFHRHVAADECLRVRGWVVEKRKRRISTEASICDQDGVERAHAWAAFLLVLPAMPPVEKQTAVRLPTATARQPF
jgi:uncharacterized protein (TIGR00369 family)